LIVILKMCTFLKRWFTCCFSKSGGAQEESVGAVMRPPDQWRPYWLAFAEQRHRQRELGAYSPIFDLRHVDRQHSRREGTGTQTCDYGNVRGLVKNILKEN